MTRERITRELCSAVTVADLIAELQGMDPAAAVLFVCDYGDYHKTQQALPVVSVAELEPCEALVESAYSHSGLAVEADEDQPDEDDPEFAEHEAAKEDLPPVVILRMSRNY